MNRDFERLLAGFSRKPPVGAAAIREFESKARIRLPEDYSTFMQEGNGGQGFIGEAYVILYSLGELLEMNQGYHVQEYAPGLFLIGSDGGGEGFAFDTRVEPMPVLKIPFVGLEMKVAEAVGSTFSLFLKNLSES